jgi:hypothetical protein
VQAAEKDFNSNPNAKDVKAGESAMRGTSRIWSVSESSRRDRDKERFENRGERGTVSRPGVKRPELLVLLLTETRDVSANVSSAFRFARLSVDSRGLTGTVNFEQEAGAGRTLFLHEPA